MPPFLFNIYVGVVACHVLACESGMRREVHVCDECRDVPCACRDDATCGAVVHDDAYDDACDDVCSRDAWACAHGAALPLAHYHHLPMRRVWQQRRQVL